MGRLVLVHFLCLCAGLSCSLSLPSNVMAPLGSCCHCSVSDPSSGLGLDSPSHKCLPCVPTGRELLTLSFLPSASLDIPPCFCYHAHLPSCKFLHCTGFVLVVTVFLGSSLLRYPRFRKVPDPCTTKTLRFLNERVSEWSPMLPGSSPLDDRFKASICPWQLQAEASSLFLWLLTSTPLLSLLLNLTRCSSLDSCHIGLFSALCVTHYVCPSICPA